jgi:hypothetical protein
MADQGRRVPPGAEDEGAEMPPRIVWHKSRRSGGGNSNCVQIATLSEDGRLIGIRDSKAAPSGPILTFDVASFRSFITAAKSGALDITAIRQ